MFGPCKNILHISFFSIGISRISARRLPAEGRRSSTAIRPLPAFRTARGNTRLVGIEARLARIILALHRIPFAAQSGMG